MPRVLCSCVRHAPLPCALLCGNYDRQDGTSGLHRIPSLPEWRTPPEWHTLTLLNRSQLGDGGRYGGGGEEVERGPLGNVTLITLPHLYTAGLSLMGCALGGRLVVSAAGPAFAQGDVALGVGRGRLDHREDMVVGAADVRGVR